MMDLFVISSENYDGDHVDKVKNLSVNIIDDKHRYCLSIRFPNMICREYDAEYGQRFKVSVSASIHEMDKIYDYISKKSDFEISKVEVLGLDRSTDDGEWEEKVIKEYRDYNILHSVACNVESISKSTIQIILSNK